MHATIGKWLVSLLHKFDFIKAKVEKHLSSSMLPIIYRMANLSISHTQGSWRVVFEMLSQGTTF
jgi:hypothetical protein